MNSCVRLGNLLQFIVRVDFVSSIGLADAMYQPTSQRNLGKVYGTRSGTFWTKPWGDLDPSLTAHDRRSSGAADVADRC